MKVHHDKMEYSSTETRLTPIAPIQMAAVKVEVLLKTPL